MKEKTKTHKNIVWRYTFALVCIIAGIILTKLQVGKDFLGFSSVGTWLSYIGFVMLGVITLQFRSNKKRIVDERMMFIASKASRITFTAIILFAFIVMIIDGISPINVAYSYFMSYLVCGIVLVYLITYRLLLKYG